EAIPIVDEEDGEDEEDLEDPPPKGTDEYEEAQMEDDASADQASDSADRFGVFIHLENVVAFLKRSGLRLNEHSVFYFLLSFPFYEHEWDISGFLLSMLGDEDDDDEDEQVSSALEESKTNKARLDELELFTPCALQASALEESKTKARLDELELFTPCAFFSYTLALCPFVCLFVCLCFAPQKSGPPNKTLPFHCKGRSS
ncbi:hypothetical protein THAOC_12093, partial [Thalassiosira oceanica]